MPVNNREGKGHLSFENAAQGVKRVAVDWELTLGQEFSNAKLWKALISFSGYSPILPKWLTDLIFTALSDPNVKIHLQANDVEEVDGHISDVLDLADCGVIELSSLNLPRAWMTVNNA